MKKICVLLFTLLIISNAWADDGDFQTMDEILYREPDQTPCATDQFANALSANAASVSQDDDEEIIERWIYQTFASPNVLQNVLKCPEIQSIDDTDHIKLQPIQYTFPNGREIIVNYETQPRILKQRIDLATKRDITALNTPSPKIGDLDDKSLWTNTDPAWYAIMVTEHGALSEFVGSNKNNTISLEYIKDNIDKLYPRGATCTSKSALANDNDIINVAMHKTVSIDDDTNDYYVAGDVNLQWISYAEIALDVVITVATMGGGVALTGVTKSARATRTMNGLRQTMRALRESSAVIDYIKLEQRLYRAEQTVTRIKKYQQIEKELAGLRNSAKYAEKAKELEQVGRELREIDKLTDTAKYTDKLKDLEKETKEISSSMREAIKADKDVEKYAAARKSYTELQQYRRAYQNLKTLKKTKNTGNVITRVWRAARATKTGNKAINRGTKIARSSIKSGRVRDWLFQSTMRNIGILGRMETAGGALYGAINFARGMYDWTETSTGEFTNNVDFAPLLLLSADDLQGQENKVNYGMWLLWNGDSTSATDDDAAYLQSMDFAEKFHDDLIDTMDEQNNHACNVDIYVVRPVLRNPDMRPEIYYLIMNDEPWTTTR